MLALLLARAGVQVTVLENHGDFLRDFRGDTVAFLSMPNDAPARFHQWFGLGHQFEEVMGAWHQERDAKRSKGQTPSATT